MRKIVYGLALVVGTVCAASAVATADDCLCAKIPMYPLGDGTWLHYAIVYDRGNPCTELYPTGYTGEYVVNQQCAVNCGTCMSLGGRPSSADLHFTEKVRDYSELDEPEEIRDFLRLISGSARDAYSGVEFRDPRVLKLERTKGKSAEAFHAICWKMEPTVAIQKSRPRHVFPRLADSEVAHRKRPPRARLAGESDSRLEKPLQTVRTTPVSLSHG